MLSLIYLPKYVGLNLIDTLKKSIFVHAFGYMFELTVTGWYIIIVT